MNIGTILTLAFSTGLLTAIFNQGIGWVRDAQHERSATGRNARYLAIRARSGLIESEGFPKRGESDSTCWLGWRPAWMARAYSLDLRERVVAAVASGQSCRLVAKTFMVSVASVVKWSQRQRAVGSPAALKMGGYRPYLVARERDWVLSRIAEKPDLTLRALLKELADRGLLVSYYALWHFLQHEGITFKKKPSRLRTGPSGRRQAA